jgi:2-dehydropantoate 2-reductase
MTEEVGKKAISITDVRAHGITIVGAGGIGGTVAAFLARAGEKVTVVDQSKPHIQAIRSIGLLVDGVFGELRLRLERALFPEELKDPLGFVVLAVKSHHTEDAISTIAPLLVENGFVVSLQNGLNERRIAEVLGPARTIGAMVHMVADHVGPGHVTRFAEGEFHIGELDGQNTERVQQIARVLFQAVPTHVTDNIWGYLWAKQIYSCLLVATALVDAPSSEILKPHWSKRIFVALMGEATEVALAEGTKLAKYDRFDPALMLVKTREEMTQAMELLPEGSAKGNSGIWRDIKVRHRKTEIEQLTGDVVRIGRKHGLPVTLNSQIFQMVKEIEEGKRPMSWNNLRSLETAANARLPV